MKYFTRQRYLAMQNLQVQAMDVADAEWQKAVDEYETYLQTIRPALSEPLRQLLERFYLHDARVLSMGQRDESFVITLQLDVPPNELLTITYTLAGPPEIKAEPFPWVKNADSAAWLYDEIEQLPEGGRPFVHSILLSNGWEMRLAFREVQMTTAFPVLPHPRSDANGASPMPATQSA
jgi:hypothetical protein